MTRKLRPKDREILIDEMLERFSRGAPNLHASQASGIA
jgi:hypothetical protein